MTDDTAVPVAGADAPAMPDAAPAAPTTTPAASEPSKSSREALVKAFASLDGQRPAAPPPAEAKPTTPAVQGDRARDESGRFVAADPAAKPAEAAPKPADPAVAKPDGEKTPDPAATATEIKAPAGLTKAAQEAWGKVPDVVRVDVERRLHELTTGIEKYKGEAERFAPIVRFDEMARQSGTTLEQALTAYTATEQHLRGNPIGGVCAILQNLGIDPVAAGQVMAGLQPQQLQQMQAAPAQQPAQNPQHAAYDPMMQRLDQIESSLVAQRAQDEINRFRSDPKHSYFDEVRDSISNMLTTGFAKDLSDAYDKAIRLSPEVAAKIAADQAAKKAAENPAPPQPDPAQTRQKAALGVTGSPSPGSNPAQRKPAGSSREALQHAFAQVGL